MRVSALLATLSLSLFSHAQWEIQNSHTTANLRGIVTVGGGTAWASGSDGTVLRTADGGAHWQSCAKPAGGEDLDLRGIQAWDGIHAIVMSSGKGALSRLYVTADGCRSWQLLVRNADPEGFWDALQFVDPEHGVLLGDPVDGDFVLLFSEDGGHSWHRPPGRVVQHASGSSVFAASNSALAVPSVSSRAFCTGGPAGPSVVRTGVGPYTGPTKPGEIPWASTSSSEQLESFTKSESSGCFSLAIRPDGHGTTVAVGGDYAHPDVAEDNAWTNASAPRAAPVAGKPGSLFTFVPATTKPGGYRSAVAFDAAAQAWIAVGPNGTDISRDNGQTWQPLHPGAGEAKDANTQWNALALPFVVGPHGRIGRLRQEALTSAGRSPIAATTSPAK